MNESGQQDAEQDLKAPSRLVAALKEASRHQPFVPPYVDQTVLNAAQQHLIQPASPRFWSFQTWTFWPALAAACVLVAWIARLFTSPAQPQFARDDLNRDGRVDILDSFALARQIKSGKPLPAAFDVNGDGVVDERDVQWVAAQAVELKKGNRS